MMKTISTQIFLNWRSSRLIFLGVLILAPFINESAIVYRP